MNQNVTKKGIHIMVVQATMFATLYLFSSWMSPLSGTVVFAWRMLGMLIGLFVLLHITNRWSEMHRFLLSLCTTPKKGLMMLITMPIIASQLWLFMWAGVNGHAVDVSIGYIIFPLAMVAGSWLYLKESVTQLQWLAIALACVGVGYQLWDVQAVSWTTAWVFGTYPIYYLLRRQFDVPALLGLTFDLVFIAPCALVYLLITGEVGVLTEPSKLWLLIPMLGLLSAWAMQLNLEASRILAVPLFSMLSYLEPILLFILSITLLGEQISLAMAISFGFICAGLVVSIADSWLKLSENDKSGQSNR